jgi:hypothetical protein
MISHPACNGLRCRPASTAVNENARPDVLTWRSIASSKICPFGRDEIAGLVAAYEKSLKTLRLRHRSDPITQLVARKIFEIGRAGVRNPLQLSRLSIKDLGA